jgi:AcrR family transcriptional regulator
MNEIAKRANIAKGTVYLYFPSKKELFISTIKEGLEALSQKIITELENIDNSVERIKKAISTHMLYLKDHQALYKILLQPDMEFMGDVLKTVKDYKLSKLPKMAEAIKLGIKEKQIRNLDGESLSYMILGMIDLSLYQWLLNPEEEPIEKKIDLLLDVLFNGILSER